MLDKYLDLNHLAGLISDRADPVDIAVGAFISDAAAQHIAGPNAGAACGVCRYTSEPEGLCQAYRDALALAIAVLTTPALRQRPDAPDAADVHRLFTLDNEDAKR